MHIVFISNISSEKNLDYAIKILSMVESNIVFDIYGRIVDNNYWIRCKKYLSRLPKNIKASYLGELKPNEVTKTFSKYDLFFFPSGGENYGHVIAESLSVGTPVLISKKTAWLNLEEQKLGWDLDLVNKDNFIQIIESLSKSNFNQRQMMRKNIMVKIEKILINEKDFQDNRALYEKTFGHN